MTKALDANFPAWPTLRWVVGEIKIYLLAIAVCGGGFLLETGLAYSPNWAIFAIGLPIGALAGLALFEYRFKHFQHNHSDRQRSYLPDSGEKISRELQKLRDTANRIAAENEALKSDIERLQRRASSRQS